jgi:hypothetical protein
MPVSLPFNSLSRDHITFRMGAGMGGGRGPELSTPSLGITLRPDIRERVIITSIDDFQLPLSGSLGDERIAGP